MPNALVVPGFSGGIVLDSSPDSQNTNELLQADGCDIGNRGQLVSAAVQSVYTKALDKQGSPAVLNPIYGMGHIKLVDTTACFAAGLGKNVSAVDKIYLVRFDPATESSSIGASQVTISDSTGTPPTSGLNVTTVAFPYTTTGGDQLSPIMVCLGARYPDAPFNGPLGAGVEVFTYLSGSFTQRSLQKYDFMGTGANGEFAGGSDSDYPNFRGIAGYNNHVFGWGYDNTATDGSGPNRLMFSNVGNPLKWGNDNRAATGGNRAFSDTDALNVGGAGEIITCCFASQGKFWIGTNRGLHYLQGYGRDSFLTDGTTGIAKSLDVIGPHAMHEGPDGLLYGVSVRGLWVYASGAVQHIYRQLVNKDRKSPGFWDLIWYDSSRSAGYPGKTNADLVWMMTDEETQQLWVVIPFCDASSGAGYGTDTVIIKYHPDQGGFTRQVITGLCLTQGMTVKRGSANPETTLMGGATPSQTNNIYRYAYRATPTTSPTSADMSITFGEYAPFGPNGVGTCPNVYITMSWESSSVLPITATLTPSVDSQTLTAITLTVKATAPAGPANGDLWLDTSATDTNIGNGTAGSIIPSTADYLLKRYISGWAKWVIVARADGSQGTRATIPIAITPLKGTRIKMACTITGSGRINIETLGLSPATIRSAA